jgi:integrating conjugative element protein (TIGR03749 family)
MNTLKQMTTLKGFRIKALLSCCAAMLSAHPTHADVTKVWNNEPLTLNIAVGQEVRVIFPTNVDLQVPLAITNQLQSLAPNRQMIYWKALEGFDKSRIVATADDGKDVYIIDLLATDNGIADNIVIEDPSRVLQVAPVQAEMEWNETEESTTTLTDPAEIVLTRFVAQTLYAPDRLLPSDNNIVMLSKPKLPANFPLLQSAKGESYQLEVLGSWMGYGAYITAVQIKNASNKRIDVNPERVRGNFTHITPQHLYLDAAGTWDDSTVLYLVSAKAFESAVVEDGYAY